MMEPGDTQEIVPRSVEAPSPDVSEDAPLLRSDEEAAKKIEPVTGEGLTIRSMITGCILGIVVAAMNVSFGLKVRTQKWLGFLCLV